MVRHSGIFSQIVVFFDHNQFACLVSGHGAERNSKGFTNELINYPTYDIAMV